MAKNNRNTNIGVGLDTSGIAEGVAQITGALRGLTAEIGKIGATTQGSVEPMVQSFKAVKDTSGLAGAGIMAFSGIVSDANYGIRGIANNLQQFSGLMVTLVGQTGSVTAAFKSLWSALMGPLGIMLAFTTGITLLERFGMQSDKAKKENDKLAKSAKEASDKLNEENASVELLFGTLSALVKENGSLSDKKKLAEEINTKYNKALNAEKLTLEDINKAYQDVHKSIITKIALEANQKDIAHSFDGQQRAQKKLNELYAEQKRIMDSVKASDNQMGERGLSVQQQTRLAELSNEIAAVEGNKTRHMEAQHRLIESGIDLQKDLLKLQTTGGGTNSAQTKKSYFGRMAMSAKDNTDIVISEMDRLVKVGMALPTMLEPIPQQFISTFVKPIKDQFTGLVEDINKSVERFAESALVGLFDAIGASIVNGSDSIKEFGKNLLGEFGSFLQQMGAMIIAYGVAMDAFKQAFTNPFAAIAAGAALIAIGGAIKAAHKKKFGESSASPSAMPYTPTSGGYAMNGQPIEIYSRIDGRDIYLSNERSQYVRRR